MSFFLLSRVFFFLHLPTFSVNDLEPLLLISTQLTPISIKNMLQNLKIPHDLILKLGVSLNKL